MEVSKQLMFTSCPVTCISLGMCVYHWVVSHEVEVKHNKVWIIPTNWVTVSARLLSDVFY